MAAYEVLLLNTAIPQIQAAQTGDTYVVPRDIAFSAALTLSAGTANGVPYLNGSKVVTTGSALTFDGTNAALSGALTIGGASISAGNKLLVRSGLSDRAIVVDNGANSGFIVQFASGLTSIGNDFNSPLAFLQNNTEQMRLVFGGLEIKNGKKLFFYNSTNTHTPAITSPSTDVLAFLNNAGTQNMTLDASGNLLVGTTSQPGGSYRFVSSADGVTANGGALFVSNQATVVNEAFSAWHTATSGDNTFCYFGTEATFTVRGSITYNRGGGQVAYNTTSDYRAKDLFGPVQNSGQVIDALKVYTGKMKGATIERPMLVAHEAQEHVPYAVTGEKDAVNEDGTAKFQQMDVSSLVPLLLAEIQSLRVRVAQLEGK